MKRVDAIQAFLDGKARVSVESEFVDDHILGCILAFHGPVEDEPTMAAFPWCGWEILAAARYADDSQQARETLAEFFEGMMDANVGDEQGDTIDDETDPSAWQ